MLKNAFALTGVVLIAACNSYTKEPKTDVLAPATAPVEQVPSTYRSSGPERALKPRVGTMAERKFKKY